MRRLEAVIDSSCVIALDVIGALPMLALLFSRVHLPKAVRAELFRRRSMKNRVALLLRELAFLVKCDDYDQMSVDVLILERRARGKKDRGEAETVEQAAQLAAMEVIDDPWGRELARYRYRLQFGGTIWVLQRLHSLGLRSAIQIRQDFAELRNRGIRLPGKTVNVYLREIGQEGL